MSSKPPPRRTEPATPGLVRAGTAQTLSRKGVSGAVGFCGWGDGIDQPSPTRSQRGLDPQQYRRDPGNSGANRNPISCQDANPNNFVRLSVWAVLARTIPGLAGALPVAQSATRVREVHDWFVLRIAADHRVVVAVVGPVDDLAAVVLVGLGQVGDGLAEVLGDLSEGELHALVGGGASGELKDHGRGVAASELGLGGVLAHYLGALVDRLVVPTRYGPVSRCESGCTQKANAPPLATGQITLANTIATEEVFTKSDRNNWSRTEPVYRMQVCRMCQLNG